MITTYPWGYEDRLFNIGRKLVFNEQFCTDIHRHQSDENIFVDNGLVMIETGEDPASMSRIFADEHARVTIKGGLWHRILSLKDSVLSDFTSREDADIETSHKGGKLSDEEFRSYLAAYVKLNEADRIVTAERAGAIASALRANGRTVGFCNGCFDLFHLGHIELLRQAKTRCDYLFVGINTDASVKLLKGDSRPFVDEVGRFAVLESCRFVDYVVEAPEKTCTPLIHRIKPDIYVTTSEYGTDGVEAKVVLSQGGKVDVINMVSGYNTTKIAMTIAGRRGK